MATVNRNDPCPCGSGKKYKKCCMLEVRHLAGVRAANREGVQKAVSWVAEKHGDALAQWVEDVWFAGVSEEERKGIATADPAIKFIHDKSLLEQMVAEGVFGKGDTALSVLQLILDGMPAWEDEQRLYLEHWGTLRCACTGWRRVLSERVLNCDAIHPVMARHISKINGSVAFSMLVISWACACCRLALARRHPVLCIISRKTMLPKSFRRWRPEMKINTAGF